MNDETLVRRNREVCMLMEMFEIKLIKKGKNVHNFETTWAIYYHFCVSFSIYLKGESSLQTQVKKLWKRSAYSKIRLPKVYH